MKNVKPFIIVFIIFSFIQTFSQNLKPTDLFSLEKIETVTKLNVKQKRSITSLQEARIKALVGANEEAVLEADKKYIKDLYPVFNKAQRKEIVDAQLDFSKLKEDAHIFYLSSIVPNLNANLNIDKDAFSEALFKFEYKFARNAVLNSYDKIKLLTEKNSIVTERAAWLNVALKKYKKLGVFWGLAKKRCSDITDSEKAIFLDYHAFVIEKDALSKQDVMARHKAFLENDNLQLIVKKLSKCTASNILKRNNKKISDSIAKTYILVKLDSICLSSLNLALNTKKSLIRYKKDASESSTINKLVAESKKATRAIKTQNKLAAIADKAQEAGLDTERIEALLELIQQKDADVAAFKKNRKPDADAIFKLNDKQTFSDINKAFSKNIAGLISKEEFSKILGEDIKPIAVRKAKAEIKDISATYDLKEAQRKKIYNRVFVYYFNQKLIQVYYGYDKKMVKQKLSGLRYYFEKDYKKMLESFNIDAGTLKSPVNRNTYQY